MTQSESEGLGVSVVIYMTAILGGLAVAVLPVYLANRPQVYDNPPVTHADPLLNGPIIGEHVSTRVPLALLKRETIVDPAMVAALNAKLEKPSPVHHAVRRTAQRSNGTPLAQLQPAPKRHTFFLFDLFGG